MPSIIKSFVDSFEKSFCKDCGKDTNEISDMEIDVVNEKTSFWIVEEISNWTDEKKVQFTHEVKDIVEYNCEHLATMSHPEVKHFEEKYGN